MSAYWALDPAAPPIRCGFREGSCMNAGNGNSHPEPLVYAVDDDTQMRLALSDLFTSVSLHVESFASPADFLGTKLRNVPGCIVLDIRLPGISGLDFQAQLSTSGVHIPIVFITGHGDIP